MTTFGFEPPPPELYAMLRRPYPRAEYVGGLGAHVYLFRLENGQRVVVHYVAYAPRPADTADALQRISGTRRPDNVAAVLQVLADRNKLCIVMKVAPGDTDMANEVFHPTQQSTMLRALSCVADALADLHERNLVHGCVTPSNIRFDRETGDATLVGLEHVHVATSPDEKVEEVRRICDIILCMINVRTDEGANYKWPDALIGTWHLMCQVFEAAAHAPTARDVLVSIVNL